jgi:GT2 family glycosyltransferase
VTERAAVADAALAAPSVGADTPGDETRRSVPVVVVTVTYGRRLELLRRTVAGIVGAGAARLIVVGNGIDAAYREAIVALGATTGIPLDLVVLDGNRGSAAGFGAGLDHALRHYPDAFLWLLDDDNCPRPDALAQLQAAWRDATADGAERVALCSLRLDRTRFVAAAMTGDGEGAFARRSAVASLDIRRLLGRRRRRRTPTPLVRAEEVSARPPVALPWAPYGGFFIHAALARELGLPDERFVLYGDDLEWTHRLVRRGGAVLLVPGSLIDDLEIEWTEAAVTPRFFLFDLLSAKSPVRLYFSTRNDIYFKTRYWSDNTAILAVNAALFALLTVALGVVTARPRNALVILRAMRDGFAGRMGGRLSGV